MEVIIRTLDYYTVTVTYPIILRIIFQTNENQGASFDEMLSWLQQKGGSPGLSVPEGLQKALDREVRMYADRLWPLNFG